ncbi:MULTISPECIES: dynamin family protein [unclassified Yoonia]|uniref:dynamin family protein n=1 Tax=unclassified Yoonia TaxID=2629118 RepID=UPI002B0003A1|nr:MULTISPECIES: dynamin family protein [unclassified Yoonia]
MSSDDRTKMAEWFQAKPVFALMGEFSAGKSTLLNMLLAQPLIPTKVTATKLPVIWLSYGQDPHWHGFTTDGAAGPERSGLPDWDVLDSYSLVRIMLDSPLLRLCDVVDTPGISDPRIASGSLEPVAENVDFCLWCTPANQAWRQSEKGTWLSLPARLRDTSILTVTRADQLASAQDLTKVIRRLETDAGPVFGSVVPISSIKGAAAMQHDRVTNQDLWIESGADRLLQEIKKSIQVAQRAVQVRRDIRPSVSNRTIKGDDSSLVELISGMRQVLKDRDHGEGYNSENAIIKSKLEQFGDAMRHYADQGHAQACVLALCVSDQDLMDVSYQKALNQVEQEIEDFSESAWCRLDETRQIHIVRAK